MRIVRSWLYRLRGLVTGDHRDREIAEELTSHLQLQIDDNLRAGMSPEEARRVAFIQLGPIESIKDEYRARASVRAVEALLQDLRYGLRMLRRRPSFAILTVSTLALGVGTTAAMFGLVDALMLRPLPHVHDPGRVVRIEEIANYPRYVDFTGRLRTIELAGYSHSRVSLGTGLSAVPLRVECVTPNYFTVLGTTPLLGRAFMPEDDADGAELVTVISHGLWERHFAGARDTVGRRVRIARRDYTVAGIAPAGFRGTGAEQVDAWLVLRTSLDACDVHHLNARSGFWLSTIGRLRDGVTWQQAAAEAVAVDTTPETTLSRQADGTFKTIALTKPPQLTPIRKSSLMPGSRDDRLAMWLAGGAVVLLLIACANVTSLLAMRAVERRREVAMRLQLGATRGRVFAQLISENLIIAGLCTIAAVAVAGGTERLLRAFYPLPDATSLLDVRGSVILIGFAVLAGLASGSIPALQAARADVSLHLRTGRGVVDSARLRNLLLVAQVALALLLIVGAGLFVRSVGEFRRELAYDLDRVIAASVDFGRAGYREASDVRARYQLMLDRVRELPEVESAALRSTVVLGERGGTVTGIGRRVDDPDGCCHASVAVSPDYFATVGVPIQRGRGFTPADSRTGASRVVILDEQLASRIFPGEDALGKCVTVSFRVDCHEVVGVSAPGRGQLLRNGQLDSEFFLPFSDASPDHAVPQSLLVRPRTSSRAATTRIASAIRSAAPDLPYVNIERLADLANLEARSWRMGASVLGIFGSLAIVLAAVGIYGALAFSIRQRTPEIGVRVAFGATPRDIVTMVFGRVLVVASLGWIAGAAATFLLTKYMRSLLFDVAPGDGATFATASAIVLAAALAGSIVPAVRASRVDPAAALRME